MFERYTEKARRVIFFARYEASQFGSPYIETEHLLLGLLRESKDLTFRYLRNSSVESIRQQVETATVKREQIPTSVDLPLSNEGKRALTYAAEEADRLSHKHIGTEHLFLGLLRENTTFAAQLLHERGVRLSAVREELHRAPHETGAAGAVTEPASSSPLGTDLTQQAAQGHLQPVVGRQKEMARLIRILGRNAKKNAILVGEPGVGKSAIVQRLAQDIADANAPLFLAEKTIVALHVPALLRCQAISFSHAQAAATIFFIDDLYALLGAGSESLHPLKAALLENRMQCICSATPEEYRTARETHRWLDRCFRPIEVPPATEAEALEVLFSAKNRLEKYHSITYTDDAIRSAVHYAAVYVKDRCLPDKALDLMDEAAAHVNARASHEPDEVSEARQRIKFTIQRMENAITNHEFEKARHYSEDERKERANLRELLKKHGITEGGVRQVTREDVEEVLAQWTGIPVATIRQGNSESGSPAPGN
jgi:ATP-dependent Clp protease ATP-binding subunit ClpC